MLTIIRLALRVFGMCDHAASYRQRHPKSHQLHLICGDCDKDLGPALERTKAERTKAQRLSKVLGHESKAHKETVAGVTPKVRKLPIRNG